MQIYQAGQLYEVVAGLYFPNPAMLNGPYNGQVPGGMNSLTIQNASFWQLQYQDAVNGTIEIPPYCTVAFTVNPGMQYTITPQWALVNTAQTGTLVLPYGWSAADVYVSGNYSPIALPPSVANTWPYSESPSIVAGEFGSNGVSVEAIDTPPQHSPGFNSAIVNGTKLTVIAGIAGESIRLRWGQFSIDTATVTQVNLYDSVTGLPIACWLSSAVGAPCYYNAGSGGYTMSPGASLQALVNSAAGFFYGTVIYDQY